MSYDRKCTQTNRDYNFIYIDTVARIGDVIAEAVVQSQGLNVDESSTGGVERVVGRIDNEPYLNTYQINHKPYSWKNQGLDIIGITGNT